MAFRRKAANLGLSVLRPWADTERYDFVIRAGSVFWRIQVKSVRSKAVHREHYRVTIVNPLRRPYVAEEIDFLAAYTFPEDTWYIFPVSVVENRKTVCLVPTSNRSRFEQYREAWKLMERTGAEPAAMKAEAGS